MSPADACGADCGGGGEELVQIVFSIVYIVEEGAKNQRGCANIKKVQELIQREEV